MPQAGCTDLKTQALPQQAPGMSICNTLITGYQLTATAVAATFTSGRVEATYKPRTCFTSSQQYSQASPTPHFPPNHSNACTIGQGWRDNMPCA